MKKGSFALFLAASVALSAPASYATVIKSMPASSPAPSEPAAPLAPAASSTGLNSMALPILKPESPQLAPETTESAEISAGSSGAKEGDKPASSTAAVAAANNLTVDEVKIDGNHLVPTEDILNVVKTKPGDKFDRDTVMSDLKAINGMGYFNDGSLQAEPKLTNDNKKVLLQIRVQENAPVTAFSYQGNNVLSSDDINRLFADQLGMPQNLNQLSGAIEKVEQAYHQRGFVLARVTDVKDDPDGSIGLTINEGDIESIQITGNKKTKPWVIKNAIKLRPGTPYNEKNLTGDLRKLYANGYFQDIRRSLVPSTTDPNKYVLKVEVDEKRTGSVGLGGGVDTLYGPFASMSFSDANFQGRGQLLSLQGQVGTGMMNNVTNSINNGGTTFLPNQKTYNLTADWVNPNFMNTGTALQTSLFGRDYGSMMVSEAMQRTIGASATFSKPLGHHLTANLGFIADNTQLKDVSTFYTQGNTVMGMINRAMLTGKATTLGQAATLASNVRGAQLTGGTYFTINPSLVYDTRDARIDPSTGTYARLTASPSVGITGQTFAKLGASVSKFVPINDSTTLALNTQVGTSFGNMPYFAGYRLGGWNGMRGYSQFSALGTGTSLLMSTAEVRTKIPLLKNSDNKIAQVIDSHVKLAGFVDYGVVGGNTLTNSLLSQSQMGAAVGVGLRIKVPMVGLVRIDAGLPIISSITGHLSPRITFGFGEKF